MPSTPTQHRRSGCRRFGRSGYTGRLITRRANSAARAIEAASTGRAFFWFQATHQRRSAPDHCCAHLRAASYSNNGASTTQSHRCTAWRTAARPGFFVAYMRWLGQLNPAAKYHNGVPHQAPIVDSTIAIAETPPSLPSYRPARRRGSAPLCQSVSGIRKGASMGRAPAAAPAPPSPAPPTAHAVIAQRAIGEGAPKTSATVVAAEPAISPSGSMRKELPAPAPTSASVRVTQRGSGSVDEGSDWQAGSAELGAR